MDIKLLSGALGAEISGVNLKDSSANNFNLIKDNRNLKFFHSSALCKNTILQLFVSFYFLDRSK